MYIYQKICKLILTLSPSLTYLKPIHKQIKEFNDLQNSVQQLTEYSFIMKINLDSKWDEYQVIVNNHSNYEYSDDEDLHVLTSEKQLFGE